MTLAVEGSTIVYVPKARRVEEPMLLSIIWLAFTVVFLALGVRHWRESRTAISELKNTIRVASVIGIPTATGTKEFVDQVNEFVKEFNARSSGANRLAALGYLAAAGTALLSAWLAWPRK
jgi:hypothetical protein